MQEHTYDVCIIGSGASGSIAASYLVQSGYDVVVIEQGDWVDSSTSYLEILQTAEPAYAEDASGHRRPDGYAWTTCNVGGGTVFYGGVSWRFREVDFDCSQYMQGEDLDVCWPYSYDVLAPFYDIVESEIGVARTKDCDPCEPPITTLALPPHPYSLKGEFIAQTALDLGLKPFPTPLAINSAPYNKRKTCDRGRLCIESFCASGAKGDALRVYLMPLLSRQNFTLRSATKAVALVQNRANRIFALKCVDVKNGERLFIRARLFIVACNAIQSAVLLLRSTSHFSPSGVGNEFGLVGRGLCYKNSVYVLGRSSRMKQEQSLLRSDYGPCSTVSMTDYYIDPSFTNGLGGLIYEMAPGNTSVRPNWGPDWLRLECLISDRPRYRNQVYLSDERDNFGLQIPVLHYETDECDRSRLKGLVERCRSLFDRMGVEQMELESAEFELGSGHLHGTCRAGHDPRSSVLDANCCVHDFDNLYVIDGSFMPYPSSLNPTLTIQANALRVAWQIAKLLK
ncbi:MAG: GMC family oxidoreductase [Acidobacteria bacterium]|nr:GMC family oxidoreductase [Acidobacteriota bacterium]